MRPIIKITSTKFDEIIYKIKEKIEKICYKFGIHINLINHKDLQKEKYRRQQNMYKLSKEKREELRKILHLDALKHGPIRDMSIELTTPPDFSKYDRK